MLTRPSPNKNLGWLLLLTTSLATPVAAHNVDVSGDVAATFHLKPNHNAKAGELVQVWFALSRKGGQIIPLEQCNCKLAVYSQPYSKEAPPVLEPPLKAISDEQYQSIPGAKIVFPKAGAYKLELSGTSKAGSDFKPFELNYEVTVAPGAAAPPPKTVSQAASAPKTNAQNAQIPDRIEQPKNQWLIPAIAIATILGLGIFGIVWRKLNS